MKQTKEGKTKEGKRNIECENERGGRTRETATKRILVIYAIEPCGMLSGHL